MLYKIELTNTDNQLTQIQEAIRIIRELEGLKINKPEILELDFSDLIWIMPCSALLLSNSIYSLSKRIDIKIIPPKNEKTQEYLSKAGFPLGGVKESETCLPIIHFTNKDKINTEVSKTIDYLQRNISPKFGQSILYLLAELSDNIDQHSQFTSASIMAQYYPKKGYMDIGLFDNGITIPGLFEEKNKPFKDDFEAIQCAFEGVSTKDETTRGFGLRTTKKLVLEGLDGEIHVFSRKGALVSKAGNKEKCLDLDGNPLSGTLIYIRANRPEKTLNIYEYIE
jgi:hypothetical protein